MPTNVQPTLGLHQLVVMEGNFPSRGGSVINPGGIPIGSIRTFAGNFAQDGSAFADGYLIPLQQNTALFSILGVNYGGDGRIYYGLPDLQGRVMVGVGEDTETGYRFGSETFNVNPLNMPTAVGGAGALIDNHQPSLVVRYVINAGGGVDNGTNTTGMVVAFLGNFAPDGYLEANGRLLDADLYPQLFATIGYTFGGENGFFRLPDLRDKTIIGAGYSPYFGDAPVGTVLGDDTIEITGSSAFQITNTQIENHQPSIALKYIIAYQGIYPDANVGGFDADTPIVGEIIAYAGDEIPHGWALADGTLLPVNQFQALYAILGNTYGGVENSTFRLPDLVGRAATEAGYGPGLSIIGLGEEYGTPSYTLTRSDLPANHAPELTLPAADYLYFAGQSLSLIGTGISVSDVDAGIGALTLTITASEGVFTATAAAGSGVGVLQNGGNVVQLIGTVTSLNNFLSSVGQLAFSDANPTLSGITLTFKIDDNGNTGFNQTDTGTVTLDVSLDVPATATNLSAPEIYTEDTRLDLIDIVVSDSDANDVITATLKLSDHTAGSLSTSGIATYDAATGLWSAIGSVADVNAALAAVTFSAKANFHGDLSIATSVDDGIAPAVTGTKTLTGTSVNDDPVANNDSYSVNEDSGATQFLVLANDSTGPDTGETLTVVSVTQSANGTVGYTSSGVTFTPNANFFGSTTFTYTISDGNGSNATATVTVDVLPQNDPPDAAADEYTVAQNSGVTQFLVLGNDNYLPDALETLTITGVTQPLGGLVTFTGSNVSFKPTADFFGTTTFTYTISDGHGGSDTATVTVHVNATPQATNLSTPQSYTEDTPLDLADIVVTDNDSNVTAILTLSDPAAGTLTASGIADYDATSGVWTASGSVADVNAALAAASFVPTANLSGTVTITTSISDGISAPVTGLKTLTGIATNDPPSATHLSDAQTYTEDTSLDLIDIVVTDIDSDVTATLKLSDAAAGSLTTSGAASYDSATGIWTVTGTVTAVNAALAAVSFVPTADFDGPLSIATSISDGVAPAITGTKVLTGSATNDAPTATHLSAAETYTEDTPLNLIDIVVTDIDSDVTAMLTLSDPAAGELTTSGTASYDGVAGVWTVSGSVTAVNAALAAVSFVPTADFDGPLSIATSISDGVAPAITGTKLLTANAVDDPPSAGAPVVLTAVDAYSGERLITQAQLLVHALDIDTASLTAVNLQISSGRGTLVDHHNGTWGYTPEIGDTSGVAFTFGVSDGTSTVASSATLDILTTTAAPTIGSPQSDNYTAPSGTSVFAGSYGTDTITFGFRLVDATVTYVGTQVVIDGPSSRTVVSGFEKYVFTDGTVNDADGNDLVDDLFYFSRNYDVWNAHMDADAHYEQYGWREGRDPNEFFSTVLYLSEHPELKGGNVSPVTDFHQTGWKSGLAPSLNFDPAAYLDANPDVKAAGLDPLEHFLYWGRQEGRQPIAPTEIIGKGGFDYLYYLQQNPDVAAAHVDPLLHFNTIGWKQGRDPNAFFDTSGYLAVYTDVAAIGMNPLDHYNQYGWKEGRDPSLDFDTKAYLAINTDVAAAQMNPLTHYLIYGQHEGRVAIADTAWWGA